jgi:SpoVK/Ycf46/Vps4 family AAA+-type ATPase
MLSLQVLKTDATYLNPADKQEGLYTMTRTSPNDFHTPLPKYDFPFIRAEVGHQTGLPFSYPALQEIDYLTLKMFEKHKMDRCLSAFKQFFANTSITDLINNVAKEIDQNVIDYTSFNNSTVVVFEGCMISILVHDNEHNGEPYSVNSHFYAKDVDFDRLFGKFNNIHWVDHDANQPYVTWALKSQSGITTNRLKASKNWGIKDVFYPSVKGGVENFYDDYNQSASPILVILGPPGMGKTSFIRNYIYKYDKDALITYDQALMETDEFFLFFLANSHDVLLLEDFDIFLKSREDDDNKIMNKFLNLSSGIVDISDKKIIVTANLDKHHIDSALVRPGRCFEVLEFDRYTERQAEAIIDEERLTFVGNSDNVSLAELFSNKRRIEDRRSVGFTKLGSEE